MHKKIYFGSLLIMAGIIGVWQLANAATTWQGPPTSCTYPGQTNCNTDGVIWNRLNPEDAAVPANTGGFKVQGKAIIINDIKGYNDFYIPDTKSIRVDKSGDSIIRIGNWGGTGNHQSDLVIYGDLKVEQRTASMTIPQIQTPWLCLNGDCRNVWPSGGGGGGTVTSVGSGNGLTGGPITGSGTLSIMTCANGQILKVSGGVWACGADIDTNSGGTLTGITAGNGISVSGGAPSPTVSINDSYGFGCANGQVRKWNGASWVCSGDATATVGAGTGIIITGTAPNYTVNVDDNRYVNVTGDTMTGSLTVQGNMDGNLTNRFGYSSTLGNWLMNIQPAGNAINTMGTINHTGAINSTGNISITGTSRITSPQYCIGASCITAWPSAGGGGDFTDVFATAPLASSQSAGPQTTISLNHPSTSDPSDRVWVSYCTSLSGGTCVGRGWTTKIPGTITGITAGANMTGGGSSGAVTLNVTDNWVNTTGDSMSGNLTINSPATLNFGSTHRQMINLNGTAYGIGTQTITTYFRSAGGFAWYRNGTHSDVQNVAGTGGTTPMTLSYDGVLNTASSIYSGDDMHVSDWLQVWGNSTLHGSATVGSTLTTGGIFRATNAVLLANNATYFSGGTLSGWPRLGMIVESGPTLSMGIPYWGSSEYQVRRYATDGTSVILWAINNTYGDAFLARGNLTLQNLGGGRGVAYKPGGGSWAATSDFRLKKNIKPISDALTKLEKLNGVEFNWINPQEHGNDNNKQGGFIAQEIEKYFPNWITETSVDGVDQALVGDKAKAINLPYEFDALVVESIKELKAQNEELKAKNQELEARLQRLEALIK